MADSEKLLEVWDQVVKTLSEKEGLSGDQAIAHVKKHFPELYELYKNAKKEKKRKSAD